MTLQEKSFQPLRQYPELQGHFWAQNGPFVKTGYK